MGLRVVGARRRGRHACGAGGVAWGAVLAVLSFNDLSVVLAIVRGRGDPAEIAPTVATISVVSSVAVYVGCFVGAPAYTAAMGAPAATGVIRVLALSVILDGGTATPVALLERHFRQDRKMIPDQVNNWLGAAVSEGQAWSGAPAMFSGLQHDQTAMRRGFLSAAALLGAVTLPVCLMISGSAVPLIGFAYGVRWLYAAQALVWLSLLAALRIFFELTYDYFVVLARTRVVFTVQLAWLVVLIPALVAAAHAGGIGGVPGAPRPRPAPPDPPRDPPALSGAR